MQKSVGCRLHPRPKYFDRCPELEPLMERYIYEWYAVCHPRREEEMRKRVESAIKNMDHFLEIDKETGLMQEKEQVPLELYEQASSYLRTAMSHLRAVNEFFAGSIYEDMTDTADEIFELLNCISLNIRASIAAQ